MSLFNTLFETFDTIKKADVADGSINGIKSLYSIPAKDLTGITIDSLNSDNDIKQKIAKLYRNFQYTMKIDSASNLDGFSKFSERLNNALDLNNVFTDDDIIRHKLADFLTYCYISISKTKEYFIYSDFNTAKNVSNMVFNKAVKSGLTFLDADTSDLIKTVLFTIFYKLPPR